MHPERILVAVDDSPAGLAAVRAAVDLVADDGGMRAVTVTPVRDQSAETPGRDTADAHSLLRWVVELARARGVGCEPVERRGEPFREILREAEEWPADLVVMGRSDRRGPSSPYLGSVTAHVLEFAECPVLVVPPAGDDGR